MKNFPLIIRFSFTSIPVAKAALLLTAALLYEARADQTNVMEQLRRALTPKPAAWGEIRVGTATRADPDPRSGAILQAFQQLLAVDPIAPPAAPIRTGATVAVPTNAIQRLKAQGRSPQLFVRPGNGTVIQIRGGVLEAAAPTLPGKLRAADAGLNERTARNFLRANRELLRLDDPDVELKLESEQRDENGARHLRFSQRYKAITLWPSGLSVHLDADGNVGSMDGAYVPTPTGARTVPILTSEDAAAHAKSPNAPNGAASDFVLVFYAPLDQPARLAWKFKYSTDLLHSWLMFIDAEDGRILNRISQVMDASVAGSAKDLEGLNENFNVWSDAGKFYMIDTTKQSFNPAFDPIKDPHGAISIFDAREVASQDLKTIFLVDSTSATTWLPDAVSALFNFSKTYDYYLQHHARNSLDGNGGNIQAVVRISQLDNAFWSGDQKMMFFGNVRPYPVALDVVGHELTHGVTQNSADLVYELQPGALNEAFSDIFGVSVEASVVGQADWKMGEKLGKVFRDMKNPGSLQIEGLNKPYPSKMSEFIDLPNSDNTDHGGVHINSSIINHAYYLLAEGLNGAIGIGDAEKIFYRCLTQRLQRQSQFIDARLGCIASAEALFGTDSTQARKTAEAFDAVEILATPPTPEPTPIPAVQGPDSTLAIGFDPFFGGSALGRRETAFNDPIDGIALVDSVKIARPAVSGDGAIAAFVDGSFDVCLVRTDNPNSLSCLGMPGVVYSVALSPDANLVAVVLRDAATGQPDNRVSVFNLAQNTTKTYDLLAPTIDGNPVDSVLNAESMVFTSDSKQLLYDAVSEIKLGGTAIQRWSIFRINLPTDTTTVLVPPIDGVNTGNPNIGRTGSRFLTFDAQDATTFTTYIINMDLFTGDFGGVGLVGQGVGFPCFNGDDTAVVYATQDITAFQTGFSLVRQELSANRLSTNGLPTLWLYDANLGVIYRRGTFTSSNALPSVNLLAPSNNGVFTAPGPVAISASANDPDGTIAKIEFYQGAEKIGQSTGPQYSVLWTNVTAGSYRLFARAIDNLGAANDSDPVNITVNPTGGGSAKLSAARQTDGAIRLTVTGPAGNYIVEQSIDLTRWVDIFPLTVEASGSGTLDDKGGPQNNSHLFYRARRN